jgi:hypothetical protein
VNAIEGLFCQQPQQLGFEVEELAELPADVFNRDQRGLLYRRLGQEYRASVETSIEWAVDDDLDTVRGCFLQQGQSMGERFGGDLRLEEIQRSSKEAEVVLRTADGGCQLAQLRNRDVPQRVFQLYTVRLETSLLAFLFEKGKRLF